MSFPTFCAKFIHSDGIVRLKAVNAIIRMVEAENPPLRLVLGKSAYSKFCQKLDLFNQELYAWESVGLATNFTSLFPPYWSQYHQCWLSFSR
ncbi:MAG: hypothetical protein F6K42_34535 [Leptolyngbya sp. SIO1D8]|nr:hypothetical protein [Leptolyngbya sp. SIO1D8]